MLSSTSARPLMPLPPTPMKWILCVLPYTLRVPLLDGLLGRLLAVVALGPAHERAGDARGGVGAGEQARVRAHPRQQLAVGEQVRDLLREALAGELALVDHHRGAAVGEVHGVHALV